MPIYMKIEGIRGDVTADGYEDWHEIHSYSWGESFPAARSTSGGGSTGRVSMSDFNVFKSSGRGSPQLFLNCAGGKHLPAVQINYVVFREDHPFALQKWTLNDVLITSFQVSASSGDGAPSESLSLNFTKVLFEQGVMDDRGVVTYQKASWDLKTNSGG